MSPDRAAGRTLSATQVAAFCEVDLKTVHNWANRGKVPGWRTKGRHLRFRRLDVVDFLRAYGFAFPDALLRARPDVAVIDEDSEALAWTRRVLSRRFELVTFDNAIGGLLAIASANPEVLVLGDVSPLDAGAVVERIRAHASMRQVRIVTLGADAKGASAWASRSDVAGLRDAMQRVTGVV
jgi:excisionase family DNA binding protein